jgi:hypothetical protein
MHSNSKSVIHGPQRAGDVVLVEVFFAVIPPYSVKTVFNLKHHSAKAANCRQVSLTSYRLVVGIEDESCLRPVLLIKTSKDQNAGGVDLVGHSQVTGYPVGLILHVYHFPHILLNIVAFTHVSDFLGGELNSATEDINELCVEDTACC